MIVPLLAACAGSEAPKEADVSSLFSNDAVAEQRSACLNEKGWDTTVADGVIEASISEEQNTAYNADSEACLREAGVDPDAPMTDEQYTLVYQWYGEIADCLQSNEFATPDKPSLSAFKDTYDTTPWIPWEQITAEQEEKARASCPVMNPPAG